MNSSHLEKIVLQDYRNITDCTLNFSKGINVITGENGQGKTNLLEAIWLLTGAKSFRGSKDKDLVQIGKTYGRIFATVANEESQRRVDIVIAADENKKGRFAKVNGGELKRAIGLAGSFYCVVFCPQHLSLVNGSPSLRRKFIDGALCQLYPGYIKIFKTFEKFLEQKNSLLKNSAGTNSAEFYEMLDIYNKNLGAYGFEIYKKRKEYIEKLSGIACNYYKQISGEKENIAFEYISFGKQEQDFYNLLKESVQRDKKAGFSTTGIQREDIEIYIDKKLAKDFASQGQQRSIVLAMKLAESDIIKEICSTDPVILLDDVLSELDWSRQEYLLNHIENKQVFISSCDENRISAAKGKKYIVKSGAIEECI